MPIDKPMSIVSISAPFRKGKAIAMLQWLSELWQLSETPALPSDETPWVSPHHRASVLNLHGCKAHTVPPICIIALADDISGKHAAVLHGTLLDLERKRGIPRRLTEHLDGILNRIEHADGNALVRLAVIIDENHARHL